MLLKPPFADFCRHEFTAKQQFFTQKYVIACGVFLLKKTK